MLQTLMLSAQSHGLATCAQGALATWGSPVRDEFDIPAGYKLLCGLSMGYASDHNVNAFNPGTHKSGKTTEWVYAGGFLDFVCSSTRAEGPYGGASYVRVDEQANPS